MRILNDPDPIEAAKEMQSNPEFAEFANLCLKTVGIRDENGDCTL